MSVTKTPCVVLLIASTACRFGGPYESATELIEPLEDGGQEDAGGLDDVPRPTVPPSSPPPSEGGPLPPADAGVASGACVAPATVPGCDPVSGTGCTPGINQCIVDRAAAEAAGRCVFPGMRADAGCEENDLFSTCPPTSTCVQGECRKYCYCDSDCDPGDTCSEPSGQGSSALFKLCLGSRP